MAARTRRSGFIVILFALASAPLIAHAGVLYSVEFNDLTSSTVSTAQYQTGNRLVFNATFANVSKSGFNAIHALQRSGSVWGGVGDYAVMIYGDNVVTQTAAFAGANANGTTYYASYDIGPTVYTDPGQATQAGDTFLVELLRNDNSVLASNAVAPGAWSGVQTFNQAYFSYVGDGSGPLRLQLSSGNTQTRFVGAIDNMAFWDTVPVPEPAPSVLVATAAGLAALAAKRCRRLG